MKYTKKLYGALLGDIAGSIYEFKPTTLASESNVNIHDPLGHITDDSLLTLAMADATVNSKNTVSCLKEWSLEYATTENVLGFGGNYSRWIYTEDEINASWGNGCLMRVSPFMWKNNLVGAIKSCSGSHEHFNSAFAVAKLFRLYRYPTKRTEYIPPVPFKSLDESCMGTIKFVENMSWFLEHTLDSRPVSTKDIILKTIKLNGDCDTNASILGELFNFHKRDLDDNDVEYVRSKLDTKQLSILDKFNHG